MAIVAYQQQQAGVYVVKAEAAAGASDVRCRRAL